MKFRVFFYLIVFVFNFYSSSLWGDTFRKDLEEAERTYQKQEYEKSLVGYEKILAESFGNLNQAALYFNLANAAFESKRLGLAFAYITEAKQLAPFDRDILHNYNFIQSSLSQLANLTEDVANPISELDYLYFIPENTWYLLTLVFLAWIAYCFLFAKYLSIRNLLAVMGFTVFLVISIQIQWEKRLNTAIVISDDVTIRSGPGDTFPEIIRVSAGSSVSIKEHKGEWAKIFFKLPNNKEKRFVGWTTQKNIYVLN